MKKNWPILLGILVLILGYEVFVLRPYNMKLREAEQKQAELQEKLNALTAPKNAATSNSANTNTNNSSADIQKPNNTEKVTSETFLKVDLGDDLNVDVHKDGRLSNLLFKKYFVRGDKEKRPVQIIENGIQWSSSNEILNKCLEGLSPAEGTGLRFVSKNQNVSCSLEYAPNDKSKRLLSTKLSVSGLKDWQGQIFVSFLDDLGQGNDLEKKTLDFKLDGKVKHIQRKDLFVTTKHVGSKDWIVWGDKYFAVGFLPTGKFQPDLTHKQQGENSAYLELAYPLLSPDSGGFQEYSFDYYFGTKEVSALKEVREDLVDAVDMGISAPVGRFLLWCLKQLNLLFKNFGFSIIALTLLVRLAFWPLNKKVFESGQKMKDLQPKMEAIKKKYGEDKSRMDQMNREIMALYKEEKVNPMGSCLPMLLQLPIFLGLYGALNHAVDLYQSPFIFWIHDLSYRDPYFVLPALWTISLIVTTQITPQQTSSQPGMPDMKKVMFVMYIVFGFLSKDWPSGLTLYLFVSNLVGVTQQLVFKKGQIKVQTVQEGV